MKTQILFTRLWNILSIKNNLPLLLAAACFSSAAAQDAKPPVTAYYDYNNNPIEMNDTSVYFIVARNNHSCFNCFIVVNDYIVKLKRETKVDVLIISESDSSTLERKRNILSGKKLLTNGDGNGVTYHPFQNPVESRGFIYTPQLVLRKKGKELVIPYSDIFNINATALSEETLKLISDFYRQ